MWAPEAHNSNNILNMPLGVLKHDDATIDWYTVHNRERWKCKPYFWWSSRPPSNSSKSLHSLLRERWKCKPYFWWSSSLLPTLPKHCIVCSESSEKTNPIFDDHVTSFNSSKTLHSLLTWKANPRNKLLVHVLDQTRSKKARMCMCAHACTYYGILTYDSQESKKLQWWKE